MKRSVLLAMADHIEKNVTERNFNMDVWLCGTVGCAVGHCVHLIPGLELVSPGPGRYVGPEFEDATQLDAVALALDIPLRDAIKIFGGDDYDYLEDEGNDHVTRAQVVERIREYVG